MQTKGMGRALLRQVWRQGLAAMLLQVNTAGRDAAMSPGNADSLAAFAGTYATHLLPSEAGEQVTPGAEIAITVNSQGARIPWPVVPHLQHACLLICDLLNTQVVRGWGQNLSRYQTRALACCQARALA